METSFTYEFYNAGLRIEELMKFSVSDSAQGKGGYSADDRHGVGSWPMVAPEKDWFIVPAELESGLETVRVNFRRDIMLRHGEKGVVVLDPRHDPAKEDPDKPLSTYPIAPTRELAIERAEKLWEEYTLAVIERHLSDCDMALAAGGRPMKAKGFTKYCFKLHGKVDPGDTYTHAANVAQPGMSADVQAVLSSMQSQQQMMNAILLAVLSGTKPDPALLEALTKPATVPSVPTGNGKPVTSGIATGQIAKPIGDRPDGWDKAKGNTRGKAERNADAEKALA